MNGLNLIRFHGDNFAVSDKFADEVIGFYTELPSDYLSHVAGLVKEEKESFEVYKTSLDSIASRNPGRSVFSENLSNGVLYIEMKGEVVESVSSFSLFGGSSYISLQRLGYLFDRIEAEYDAGIKDIKALSFIVDSPGGVAIPSLNMAKRIEKLGEKIPIYSFLQNLSASAGYALPASSTEIWASTFCEIGSIGAVCGFVNTTPADKKAGIETVYKTSGKNKRPLTKKEDGTLSDEGHKFLQDKANELGSLFSEFVFEQRAISDDKDKETIAEAGVFQPEKAMELGLIDGVSTLQEFKQHVNEKVNGKKMAGTNTTTPPSDGGEELKVTNLQQNQSLSTEEKAILEFCSKNNLGVQSLENLFGLQQEIQDGLVEEVCGLYTSLTGDEVSEEKKKQFSAKSIEELRELSADYEKITKKSSNPVRKSADNSGGKETFLSPREALEKFENGE